MSSRTADPQEQTADVRVAVLPLFFGRTDVVRGCLEPLLASAPGRFDIYAIENPSEDSEVNRALLLEHLEAGRIAGVYLPERNAVFNALLIALARDLFGLAGRYDYLVLSDGDVAVGPDPFREQQFLLEAHPQMSSCSVRIDIRKWSQASPYFNAAMRFADAAAMAEEAGQPYGVTGGGFWMRMFRTPEILRLARTFDRNGLRMRDSTIDRYFMTAGMFPATALRSLGVELPHGPLFDPASRSRRKGLAELARQGQDDAFNNNLSPGGVVRWPDRVQTFAPETLTLAVAEPAEAIRPALGWPDAVASRPTRAVLMEQMPLANAPAPVVLLHEPRMRRTLVADDGAFVMTPLVALAEAEAVEPFLDEIAFDARERSRWPKRFLSHLMVGAAKALRPGGRLAIRTADWRAQARRYTAALEALTAASRARGKDPFPAAVGAMKAGRPFQDQALLLEPGQLCVHALQAGLQIVSIEEDAEAGTLLTLAKPG